MATKILKITSDWVKVASGEAVVLQNRGIDTIETATVKSGEEPEAGFLLKENENFNYPGGDEVWVRCPNGMSFIAIDNIGV